MTSPEALRLLQEIKEKYLDNPDLKMEVSLSSDRAKADFRFVPRDDTDKLGDERHDEDAGSQR